MDVQVKTASAGMKDLAGTDTGAAKVHLVDAGGNPLSVSGGGATPGTYTNANGTITTGGVAQQLFAAGSTRKFARVINTSTGSLWIREGGTATAAPPSWELKAGFEYEWAVPPAGAVSIIGATTGQSFTTVEAV